MDMLPQEVLKEWKNRKGATVFTTVAKDGTPNSIWVTCVDIFENSKFVIADNFFHKTGENIRSGSTASVLFITKEDKAYQIKGKIEYYDSGKYFDFMKSWNPEKLPGHGAAVIIPEIVYSGANEVK